MSDEDVPHDSAPPRPERPPLLEYPSKPNPSDLDTEPWSQVGRAMAVVFGILLALMTIAGALCGVLSRGCG